MHQCILRRTLRKQIKNQLKEIKQWHFIYFLLFELKAFHLDGKSDRKMDSIEDRKLNLR